MRNLTPAINILDADGASVCGSCGARNFKIREKSIDVDELFEIRVGSQFCTTVIFCAPCLQVLAQVIHPHRTGS